jgi:hypothetical protein
MPSVAEDLGGGGGEVVEVDGEVVAQGLKDITDTENDDG